MRIPYAQAWLQGNEKEYMVDALATGWISGGKYIEQFESQLYNLFDKRALVVSNGTSALHLAYLGSNLNRGDSILVPGFGFLACANIALHMGLKPIFVDVDKDTWCMDVNDLRKKAKGAKAVVPVHTYGNVCNMDEIIKIANEYSLIIIEDAAEAFLSSYRDSFAGTLGNIGTFSLHATKTITTGEGGFVLVENEDTYNKMVLYRSHGMPTRGKYYHSLAGHNFRMTNFQAAMGCAQLENAAMFDIERLKIYEMYQKYLSNIPGVKLQKMETNVTPCVWAVGIQLDEMLFDRDTVIQIMKTAGVETRPGFISSSFLSIYPNHSLPVAENLTLTTMSLPTFVGITEEQIKFICEILERAGK